MGITLPDVFAFCVDEVALRYLVVGPPLDNHGWTQWACDPCHAFDMECWASEWSTYWARRVKVSGSASSPSSLLAISSLGLLPWHSSETTCHGEQW